MFKKGHLTFGCVICVENIIIYFLTFKISKVELIMK